MLKTRISIELDQTLCLLLLQESEMLVKRDLREREHEGGHSAIDIEGGTAVY